MAREIGCRCVDGVRLGVVLDMWVDDDAVAVNPDGDDEPVGWVKQVGTERRACGWLRRSRLQAHAGFDPACPDCGDPALV